MIITSKYRNAKKNHNKIVLHIYWYGFYQKKKRKKERQQVLAKKGRN